MKFNPRYELIVGKPSRLNNFIIPKYLVSPKKLEQGVNGVDSNGFRFSTSPDGTTLKSGDYLDYNTIPPQFYKITDLQIVADIPESVDQGSKVTFQVTNLPTFLKKFLKKDDIVCFRAEYLTSLQQGEELPDVYVGQIVRIYTSFPDTDSVTTIECGAGATIRKNSRISYSWPPNTTREKVVRDMLQMLNSQGMPTGTFTMPPKDSKAYSILKSPYLSGYSMQGNTVTELNKILDSCKMKGFISKGKYSVQPFITGIHSTQASASATTFKLNASNIKGTPELLDGETSTDPSAAIGINGQQSVSVVTYFDSRVGLEDFVSIDNSLPDFEGDYRITSLRRVYDHRGGRYETLLNLVGGSNG